MRKMIHELDPETYVLCKKAAALDGKTVEEWISFLVSEKVGHTPFSSER